jgi:peptidoglycan/xylan/chitin deacetylase (PgdA/CDA1 family)
MSDTHQLDVVMYHFVRPIADSAWPGIKGLEATDFDRQLDYLQATYDMLTPRQAVDVMTGRETLCRRACLLTFDDGYRDHHDHVFPRLEARSLKGLFFPPACAALDREMLDVNKIHFILAGGADPTDMGALIDDAVSATPDLREPTHFRAEHHKAFGYDTADVIYVKRMLQHALPPQLRARLTDALFRQSVSADPADFANSLYCGVDELRAMHEAGHMIGSHGSAHMWLNELPREEQHADIQASLRLFDAISAPRTDFAFCYPYGGYNAATLECLEKLGCAAAFTTRPDSAMPGTDGILEIPRLDTNVFPPRAEAAPFAMTA